MDEPDRLVGDDQEADAIIRQMKQNQSTKDAAPSRVVGDQEDAEAIARVNQRRPDDDRSKGSTP